MTRTPEEAVRGLWRTLSDRDYGAIMNAAPASWVESLATADTSWVYDASGDL